MASSLRNIGCLVICGNTAYLFWRMRIGNMAEHVGLLVICGNAAYLFW